MDGELDQILNAARQALLRDRTIDIVTTGARTGLQRRTEIWFTNMAGRRTRRRLADRRCSLL